MTRILKTLLVVLTFVAIISTTACWYFYESYTGLHANYKALVDEYESVLSRHRQLQSKYEHLENTYTELAEKYESLKVSYENLESKLRKLEQENAFLAYIYDHVTSRYRDLEQKYDSLLVEHAFIVAEYRALKENYTLVQAKYSHLERLAVLLNTSLSNISLTLLQLCCIPEAFTRVLTIDRVNAVERYVRRAGVRADDPWTSIQAIYNWIRSNVRYVHDVPVPAPRSKNCDPPTDLCIYEFAEAWNYVQVPELTAILGQGDCDDQAVLAYAMIKYYLLYVHGKDTRVWIALVQLGRGLWHMALFIPVTGGRLTIVYPAGPYLTTTWYGTITANPVREELARYSNYWREYGGIRYVELYDVDVFNGRYELLFRGDLESTATYIKSATG